MTPTTGNRNSSPEANDPHSAAPSPRPRPGTPYRWLLFDADGTLFDFERAEATALERAFRESGVAFATDFLPAYRRINHALWQALEQKQISPQALKVRRFELLLGELKLTLPPDPISVLYLECLAECSELVEDAHEVLENLHRHYKIAIVTNGLRAVQRPRLLGSLIREHVAELIISEEIGAAKPAREFFDVTFTRLGQPAREEVLLIGDSWSSDIQGAVDYGLDACWYNPKGLPRPPTPPIKREIRSLRELLDWLR